MLASPGSQRSRCSCEPNRSSTNATAIVNVTGHVKPISAIDMSMCSNCV